MFGVYQGGTGMNPDVSSGDGLLDDELDRILDDEVVLHIDLYNKWYNVWKGKLS